MTKRSGFSRRKKAKQRAAAAAAAVAYPSWVLLERYCTKEIHGSSSSVADTKTRAASHTAAGHLISVALSTAAPPESSRVCVQVQLPCGFKLSYCTVMAAHGDSVMINVAYKAGWQGDKIDYFVYSAGDAAADPPRPPSLYPLPPCTQHRFLNSDDTGLLRCGEDELVVAVLNIVLANKGMPSSQMVPELVLFRSGKWSISRPPVVSNGGDGAELDLLRSWYTSTAAPVGDRVMTWSDQLHGVFFSDVLDEKPTLQYVPFPVESPYGIQVCVTTATAGSDTLKLIAMFPRCCCGNDGASQCPRSIHAYTVKTWILKTDDLFLKKKTDYMAWVLDGMVDSTEICALDAYDGLPHVELDDPVVSLDDPSTITFALCEDHHVRHYGVTTVRLLTVDTRTRTISSVFCYPPERQYIHFNSLIPSRMSSYLNSSYPSQGNGGKSSPSKTDVDIMASATNNAAINSSVQSFSNLSLQPMHHVSDEEVSLEKVLMVLEDILDLARDEMLKAFSVLIYDSGRRFRSLLELPKNLRKDWLLIEVKASEACSTFSACTKHVQHA